MKKKLALTVLSIIFVCAFVFKVWDFQSTRSPSQMAANQNLKGKFKSFFESRKSQQPGPRKYASQNENTTQNSTSDRKISAQNTNPDSSSVENRGTGGRGGLAFITSTSRFTPLPDHSGQQDRKKFKNSAGRFQFLSHVYAVGKGHQDLIGNNEIVGENAGFIFFHVPPGTEPPQDAVAAAITERSNTLSAVTGLMTVKFNNMSDVAGLSKDFGLNLIKEFKPIKVAVLKSLEKDPDALVLLLNHLQQDVRTVEVDLEVINVRVVPR